MFDVEGLLIRAKPEDNAYPDDNTVPVIADFEKLPTRLEKRCGSAQRSRILAQTKELGGNERRQRCRQGISLRCGLRAQNYRVAHSPPAVDCSLERRLFSSTK